MPAANVTLGQFKTQKAAFAWGKNYPAPRGWEVRIVRTERKPLEGWNVQVEWAVRLCKEGA